MPHDAAKVTRVSECLRVEVAWREMTEAAQVSASPGLRMS